MTKDVGRKDRLDVVIHERGLVESREQARRLILAGKVQVEGVSNPKPGMRVAADIALSVTAPERYVSRGGRKLEAALQAFELNPAGRVCADIGASTGGFTDCLLQHGAARVYAVDVGVSQIHEKLRHDPRVQLVEHTNARQLDEQSLPEKPSLLAVDVSFISLSKILPALARVCEPGGSLVALIKPQFEAERSEVSRGKGVIRDPEVHRRILQRIVSESPDYGWIPCSFIPSPITGGSGNFEYLMYAVNRSKQGEAVKASAPADGSGAGAIDIDALLRATLLDR